jgi:hypothetical protein
MHEERLSSVKNEIRRLFVALLTFGDSADAPGLLYGNSDAMAEDQRHMTERLES